MSSSDAATAEHRDPLDEDNKKDLPSTNATSPSPTLPPLLPHPNPTFSNFPAPAPTPPLAPVFDGKRASGARWLRDTMRLGTRYEGAFQSEHWRVVWMVGGLRDAAADWWDDLAEQTTSYSIAHFKSEFTIEYVASSASEVLSGLIALKQAGSPIADHNSAFSLLANLSAMPPVVLLELYYSSLNASIVERLLRRFGTRANFPDTVLKAFASTKQEEREDRDAAALIARAHGNSPSPPTLTPALHLNAARLSSNDKVRRIANKECLYCVKATCTGAAGGMDASACPELIRKLERITLGTESVDAPGSCLSHSQPERKLSPAPYSVSSTLSPLPSPDLHCSAVSDDGTHLVLNIRLRIGSRVITVQAMVDTGANGTFIHPDVVRRADMITTRLPSPRTVQVVDGRPISSGVVTEQVFAEVELDGISHPTELLICSIGRFPVILGLPWLQASGAIIHCSDNTLSFPPAPIADKPVPPPPSPVTNPVPISQPTMALVATSHSPLSPVVDVSAVLPEAFVRLAREESAQVFSWSPSDVSPHLSLSAAALSPHQDTAAYLAILRAQVPPPYHDLLGAFSKAAAESLPPHRPEDHSIDLEPGTKPPFGPVYSMSEPKLAALSKYLKENLANGFIRRSSSAASSPVLLLLNPTYHSFSLSFNPCLRVAPGKSLPFHPILTVPLSSDESS